MSVHINLSVFNLLSVFLHQISLRLYSLRQENVLSMSSASTGERSRGGPGSVLGDVLKDALNVVLGDMFNGLEEVLAVHGDSGNP